MSHEPIAGRPEMVVPVFMKVWAGSWLIASVTIERMMQMSSATVARCGKIALISWPLLPHRSKRMLRSEADQLRALKLGDRHALGERLGHRLPVHPGQCRLVVERLQVRRAAGHVEVDDPLDLGSEMQRDAPRRSSARAGGAGSRSASGRPRGASSGRAATRAPAMPMPGRRAAEERAAMQCEPERDRDRSSCTCSSSG